MPKYDPKKEYSWNEDEIFTMTGIQFASFFHLCSNEMNVTGGATLGLKAEAFQVMMNIFRLHVENGKIYEKPKEEAPHTLNSSNDPSINNLFS